MDQVVQLKDKDCPQKAHFNRHTQNERVNKVLLWKQQQKCRNNYSE